MATNIQAVTEAIQTNIAGFRPQSRPEVEAFFAGLPELLREFGSALNAAAGNIEDQHIHSNVIDMLRELGHVVAGTADTAEQTYASHTSNHWLWLSE